MNKEKAILLTKMQELKDKRESEISNQELDIKIVNVKYLGKIKWIDEQDESRVEKEKDIFMIIEDRNGSMVYKYYDENMEMIAAQMALDNNLLPNKKFLSKEDKSFLKDIEDLDKVGESLEDLKREKEQEEKGKTKNEDKKESEDKEITGFKTDKSGATSLDQMIDGVTLRNILKLDGDYECIKPVSASQVKNYTEGISNKDAVIAIKKNGECIILDDTIIRPDRQEGNNSFDRDLTIENDGDVTYKSNTSSYQIVNRPNYYISIGYDEGSSKKEIKLSKRSGRDGDREVEFELQKYGASEYIDSDARKLRQENEDGIEKSEVIANKQKQHEEVGCENDRVENIDNYEDNNIHEHYVIEKDAIVPGKDMTFEEWAEELGENTDVIIDRFKREIEKNPKEEPERVADGIEEDYEMINREHNY